MPHKLTIPSLLLLVFLAAACAGKQAQSAAGKVVDLSGIWDKPEDILLSSIAGDIEYIPLETSPECLLGGAESISATVLDQYIVVNSKGLRLFDRQGKYLRTIGSIGKGPQEYAGSGRFVFDEKNGRIDILDGDRHRVVSYGITGGFIRSIPVADHAALITRDQSNRIGIMYLPWDQDVQDTARFEWISEEGGPVKSIPLYVGRPKDGGSNWLIGANLYWEQEKLVFAEWPYDTLYYLVDDRAWKPLWIPQTGPNKMPREVSLNLDRWSAQRNAFTSLFFNLETSRYLFFGGERKGKFGLVYYDKVTSSGHWKLVESDDEAHYDYLINDLDGGMNISYPTSNGSSTDNYVTVISPIDLISRFRDHPKSEWPTVRPELRERLFKMVDGLREEDNPVIMIVKLKI
ncbi:MAG: 6-bladed beta-propeller [Bacteroidales bacterium]|jgi:hypothetical protein